MVTFVLSILLGLMGFAAAKTSGIYADVGNWELYNYQIKTGETFLIIAAIGLAVSWPLGSLFDKKARKLLKEKYAKMHPYPDLDASKPMQPTNPKCMDLSPRDKPMRGK